MLNTVFPRPAGDIGNAATWPFPVRYRVVSAAIPERVVQRPDDALLAAFVEAARERESEGVRAITTSCGFLALYQRELTAAVSVPVATSSLLQVPMIARTLPASRMIGSSRLAPRTHERHFPGWGRLRMRASRASGETVFRAVLHAGEGRRRRARARARPARVLFIPPSDVGA